MALFYQLFIYLFVIFLLLITFLLLLLGMYPHHVIMGDVWCVFLCFFYVSVYGLCTANKIYLLVPKK